MPYFALDGANNKIETLSKEEILTAIENARIGRSLYDYDNAIVSRIRELNKNDELRFWIGTQAEYNALATKENSVLYIISDDNSKEDIIEAIESLQNSTDALTELVNEAMETEAADIENERLQRAAADLNLDNKINSTKTELQQKINDEATARETAVSSEKTARQNADAALQANINAANSNINNLQSEIDTAESNIARLVADLASISNLVPKLLFAGTINKGAGIQLSESALNFRALIMMPTYYKYDGTAKNADIMVITPENTEFVSKHNRIYTGAAVGTGDQYYAFGWTISSNGTILTMNTAVEVWYSLQGSYGATQAVYSAKNESFTPDHSEWRIYGFDRVSS